MRVIALQEEPRQAKFEKCVKKVTSCVMRESKQKCGNFMAIVGNLEGLLFSICSLVVFGGLHDQYPKESPWRIMHGISCLKSFK